MDYSTKRIEWAVFWLLMFVIALAVGFVVARHEFNGRQRSLVEKTRRAQGIYPAERAGVKKHA